MMAAREPRDASRRMTSLKVSPGARRTQVIDGGLGQPDQVFAVRNNLLHGAGRARQKGDNCAVSFARHGDGNHGPTQRLKEPLCAPVGCRQAQVCVEIIQI